MPANPPHPAAKSSQEFWIQRAMASVGFILFFAGLAAILCGLLFVTGNADFRNLGKVRLEPTATSFGGLSEIPTRLER